jgi:hypothetical protein
MTVARIVVAIAAPGQMRALASETSTKAEALEAEHHARYGRLPTREK